jgi:hypothetical protein
MFWKWKIKVEKNQSDDSFFNYIKKSQIEVMKNLGADDK